MGAAWADIPAARPVHHGRAAHPECQVGNSKPNGRNCIMSNKADPVRAAELAAILAQRYPLSRPAMVARVMVEAVKLARYVRARAELECSYPMTEENMNRAARRIERAANRVNVALAEAVNVPFGAGFAYRERGPWFEFGGDPRGACGRLHVPGMDGDGWSRDGFPLY
jgi:hypothetical protein